MTGWIRERLLQLQKFVELEVTLVIEIRHLFRVYPLGARLNYLGAGLVGRGAGGVAGRGAAGRVAWGADAGAAFELAGPDASMRRVSSAVISFCGLNQTTLF